MKNNLTLIILDKFLKENGVEEDLLDYRQRLHYLKQIRENCQIECDITEQIYMRDRNNKDISAQKKYVDTICHLETKKAMAQHYILEIKKINRDNRRLKLEESIQKVLYIKK